MAAAGAEPASHHDLRRSTYRGRSLPTAFADSAGRCPRSPRDRFAGPVAGASVESNFEPASPDVARQARWSGAWPEVPPVRMEYWPNGHSDIAAHHATGLAVAAREVFAAAMTGPLDTTRTPPPSNPDPVPSTPSPPARPAPKPHSSP